MFGTNTLAGGGTYSTTTRRSRSRLLTAAAMAALGTGGLLGQRARAANDTWVGNTSGNWATGSNWSAAVVPVNGDSLLFGTAGSAGANLTDNLLTAGLYNIAGITFNSGASAFVINPGSPVVNGFVLTGPIADNSTNTETLNDAFTVNAVQNMSVGTGGTLALGGAISGTGGLIVSGGGTLNLSGTDIYTGTTTVNQGTTNISSTFGSSASTSTFIVGDAASQNGRLNIATGATLNAYNLTIGAISGASGSVYQTGGLVTLAQAGGTGDFAVGGSGGASGYFNLSGGRLVTNEVDVSGYGTSGVNVGVMDVTGGTLVNNGWITIQRAQSGGTGNGVLNVTGGTVYTGEQNTGEIGMLWGGGTAQLNVTNASIIGPNNGNGASGYLLNLSTSNVSGSSVVNLNSAGLLEVSGVISSGTAATQLLNFNGGTLKYAGAGATNASFLISPNISTYVYGGGATIDSGGGSITLTRPLLAPTGSGVSALALTGLTTTGYIGAPAVVITGGSGVGATGVANINSSGVLTGITITNPGSGYSPTDTLTVSLSGGGVASSSSTTATPSFTANVNTGGLTLNGGGTITLATPTTYGITGNTTLNGGKLILDFNQSSSLTTNIINPASQLVLNGGNLTVNGRASATVSQTFASTSLTDGGALISMTPVSSNPTLLNLGAITRTAPATTNLTLSGTSNSTNGIVTSTLNNTAGILGGWATVGSVAGGTATIDWATNSTNASGGNLVAYSGYNTTLPTTGGSATANYQTAAATTTLTGNLVANSLKLTSAVTTVALGSNALTLNGSSGGLLVVGSNGSNSGPTISGTGVLSAGPGNELIIQDWGNYNLSNTSTPINVTISAPLLAANDTGRVTKAGTGSLTISSANSYTGGTMIAGGLVTLNSNTALGSGTIELNPDGVYAVANGCGIALGSGVKISNNITVDAATYAAGNAGTISATGAAGGEIDGNIVFNTGASPGGNLNAPTTAGVFLTIKGSLTSTVPPDNSTFVSPGTSFTALDAIVIRSGNVRLFGGGSYFRIDSRNGVLQDGATNGIATNASVDIGANGTASLDLSGFNQTLTGISTTSSNGNTRVVTNSSTTSASTLTLTPLPVGSIDGNLAFGGLNASGTNITDASASFPLNITINGDPTGVQTFAGSAYSYHGVTTLLNSTLSIPALANGGSNSSIGASSNAASNLVFGGGTLLYTGATTSTDRSFTVNANSTATMNISNSAAVVTFSSAGTAAATTNGAFNKLGAGTLAFSGSQPYTGTTTVGAGTFQLTTTGSLAGGVFVSTGASFIAGGTTVGSTVLATGGTIIPGAASYTAGTIPTVTLTSSGVYNTGALTLQKASNVDFAFGTGVNAMFNLSSSAPLTLYGGNLDLTNSGAATAFSTSGTYTLINYTGAFGGSLGNFTIADPTAGKAYAFINTGTQIQLTISNSSSGSWTNANTTELWTDNGNWLNNSIPNSVSATAIFGSNLVNTDGNVNLASTNETVGTINFDNTSTPSNTSFTIKSTGTGILTLDNGGGAGPQVNVVAGNHTISAPVTLNAPVLSATNFNAASGSTLTLSGNISAGANGTQTANFSGGGTVILAGTSNAIGVTNLIAGTLQQGNGGTVGSLGTGTIAISSGATLAFNRSDSANVVTNTISGTSGIVQQAGTGTTTLTPSSANTFGTAAGGVVVSAGTLKLGNANALPTGVLATINGGSLDLNGFSTSVASLTGGTASAAGGVITDNSSTAGTTTLTDTGGTTQAYYGSINDGANGRVLAFSKAGSGIVQLGGSSTYSGGTSQTIGEIDVLNSNALGTGPVTMSGTATQLKIANGLTVANKIIVNASTSPGTALGVLTTMTPTDTATFTGEIDYNTTLATGGLIVGPGTSGLLTVTGPIIESGANPPAFWQVRGGNVQLADATGLSSYPEVLINGSNNVSLGHNNGIATNALLSISSSTAFDLNGYNQTVSGIGAAGAANIITDTNGSSPNTGPGTGPYGTSVLTVNTSSTLYPDSAPDVFPGQLTNYVQLIKTGTGTLSMTNTSLTANNSYFGGTIIEQGVLAVATLDAGNVTSPNGLGISYSGAADLVFAQPGGTLRYTGTTSSSARAFTINDGTTATLDVSTAGSTLTWNGSATVDGTESTSPAGLAKGPGAGTLVLTGTYPYHGNTTVNGGTLLVTGTTGTAGSGNIVIASGGTLGGTGTVSGSLNHSAGTIVGGASATVPTTGSLTFTDPLTLNGGTDLNNINGTLLSSSPIVNQQGYIAAAGGLSFGTTSETVNLQVTNTPAVGSYVYNLFTYTGTLSGTPNLSYVSNLGRATFTTDLTTAGEVNVDIVTSTAASLYWNSTTSGVWDIHTNGVAASGTANWYNSAANLATDKFYQGDNVTFADSGTPVGTGTLGTPLQTSITIASGVTVQPGSVTDTANTNNYNISGAGSIGGTGALTLSGASTLTLSTSNVYTGGTNINGGLLALNNTAAIGTIGTISFGGGTLQYSSVNTTDYSGRFSTANNQAVNVDTNGQNVTFASNLTSSGGTLNKLGAGTLTLAGAANTYNGATTLTGGTLSISAQGNLGGNGPVVFNGGSLTSAGGFTSTASALTNALVVNAAGGAITNTTTMVFSGSMTGSGTLTSSSTNADVFTGSGFTAGNNSSTASFTGTLVSQFQVNITDVSASPYAAYNASVPAGNAFLYGVGTPPAGPIQLGSLTGVAGSAVRNGNTAGIGPVIWQIGALGTNTVFAGNMVDNYAANALNTSALRKVGTGSLTMSGTNTYSGGTTVTAGTLILASTTAFPSASSLNVSSGALLQIAVNTGPTGIIAPLVSPLTNNGKIDITNNDLIVRGSTLSAITSQVLSGLAGGNGITSSSIPSPDTLYTIGVVQAAAAGSLDGAAYLAGDVEAKYTYYGDANLDGAVDGSDYTLIDNGFNNNLTGWANGDFNYDGVVDGSDYTLIDNAFNTQGATLGVNPLAQVAAQVAGGTSAVPEPTTLGLLGIGAIGLLGRRRRR